MREKTTTKIFGWIIAIPICALIFMWYNYVWIRWNIAYWQWLVLSIPFSIIAKITWVKWTISVICIVALIAQTAAWIHLITLPIVK